MSLVYKVLSIDEFEDYKSIRLELLKENPLFFGSSYEEESVFDNSRWEYRLKNSNAITLAAYMENTIVGICVLMTNPRSKMKHKAVLNSMYVKPEYRRQGIANGLLKKAYTILLDRNVEILQLTVMSENIPAIESYLKQGFIKQGKETKAIKYNNQYYDLISMQKVL